jgi:hypothetical protein
VYASAPLYYSYFEVVSLSYGLSIPRPLVRIAPFSWWAQLPALYQPQEYDSAAVLADMTCEPRPAESHLPDTENPHCLMEIQGGSAEVRSPPVMLRTGGYVARFELSPEEKCESATVMLQVRSDGSEVLAVRQLDVTKPQKAELPFSIEGFSAMRGGIQLVAKVQHGCVVLSGVGISVD